MGQGLFPGVSSQRLLPSQQGVTHQLLGTKDRLGLGLGIVIGQLGSVSFDVCPIYLF